MSAQPVRVGTQKDTGCRVGARTKSKEVWLARLSNILPCVQTYLESNLGRYHSFTLHERSESQKSQCVQPIQRYAPSSLSRNHKTFLRFPDSKRQGDSAKYCKTAPNGLKEPTILLLVARRVTWGAPRSTTRAAGAPAPAARPARPAVRSIMVCGTLACQNDRAWVWCSKSGDFGRLSSAILLPAIFAPRCGTARRSVRRIYWNRPHEEVSQDGGCGIAI